MATTFGEMSANNLSQAIQKSLDKELDEFIKQIKAKIPSKVQAIKSEIYSAYTTIVKNTYLNTFQGYYGNNFDINSLMDSLTFMSGKSITPDFSYNEKVFKFSDSVFDGIKFNQNADSNEYMRFSDPTFGRTKKQSILRQDAYEEIQVGYYEAQQQGDTQAMNEYLDQLEYIDSSKFMRVNNMQRPEGFVELSRVYKIARDKSLEEFNKEYNGQLKPRITKKYGIKL